MYQSPFFTGELSRDWAREHRNDPPVQPGSVEYEQKKLAVQQGEASIRFTKKQIRAMRASISSQASKLAPIKRVPNEILASIFSCSAIEKRILDGRCPKDLLSILLTCHLWRRCCYRDSTRFGADIHIQFKETPSPELMDGWLERSCTVPWNITISPLGTVDWSPFLPTLLLYKRWGSLTLPYLGGGLIMEKLASLTNGSTSNMFFHLFLFLTPIEVPIIDFESLRQLDVESSLDFLTLLPKFRASNLDYLRLGYMEIDDVALSSLVKLTPNLKVLFFENVRFPQPDDSLVPIVPIGHPGIEKLYLRRAFNRLYCTIDALKVMHRLMMGANRLKQVTVDDDDECILQGDKEEEKSLRKDIKTLKPLGNLTRLTINIGITDPIHPNGFLCFLTLLVNIEELAFFREALDTFPTGPLKPADITSFCTELFETLDGLQKLHTLTLLDIDLDAFLLIEFARQFRTKFSTGPFATHATSGITTKLSVRCAYSVWTNERDPSTLPPEILGNHMPVLFWDKDFFVSLNSDNLQRVFEHLAPDAGVVFLDPKKRIVESW